MSATATAPIGISDETFGPSAFDMFAADEGQVRHDLVTRIHRQIEMGLYEEDGRIDALLERLMADLRTG